jgi:hypothetical protein
MRYSRIQIYMCGITVAQLVKKFSTFHRTHSFITVCTSARDCSKSRPVTQFSLIRCCHNRIIGVSVLMALSGIWKPSSFLLISWLALQSMHFTWYVLVFINLIHISQQTHLSYIHQWLMLFGEIITACYGNGMKHISKLCRRNAELFCVKAGATCINHSVLKGQNR